MNIKRLGPPGECCVFDMVDGVNMVKAGAPRAYVRHHPGACDDWHASVFRDKDGVIAGGIWRDRDEMEFVVRGAAD